MAKQGGLGARFAIGGFDLSGDMSAIDTISGGPSPIDFTDITQLAAARQGGQRSGTIEGTSFFDPAPVTGAHPVLAALPVTDTQVMTWFTSAIGADAAACTGLQLNYDGDRNADGSFMFKFSVNSDGFGLEWGNLLTAGFRTDSAATLGTGFDNGAATAFGAQAYLQALTFTGTSATVVVEHSTDNITYATLMSFAAVSANRSTQRISVANTTTVNRWLRVSTTGTFSSFTFACMVNRNPVAGVVF